MKINETKKIMALLFQAQDEKNRSLIENYLADSIKWHDGCYGENGSDIIFDWKKEDFIKFVVLGNGFGGFEKTKTLICQIAEGDKVFTSCIMEGIFDKGNIWGKHHPNGKKLRFTSQYITRFENGLIVEMWVLLEGHTILKQLGVEI
jgi:hypothetical protein